MSLLYTHRTVGGIVGTRSMKRVLLVLLTDAPDLSVHAFTQAAELGAGTVYVNLARLERAGWVNYTREESAVDRPPRRLYRLTPDGRANASELLGLRPSRQEPTPSGDDHA
ncbi:helix-turn-helix transcriptional regulator [Sphaerisporangium sp. TRM90804]|uniref:PadR family transcriptional regulator n=1 Tax=Sphaerisporangium sp. TRM90804 TaxID=3031113 RepID=UPI00244966AD|nr:helix-turn-helix transcriptional regulator [Sphaerisporangium sp. TRM90804]MDH2424797.1 helix-turn-helix transcriptional regulator [Sphaerisporangium sp. TRM90804]